MKWWTLSFIYTTKIWLHKNIKYRISLQSEDKPFLAPFVFLSRRLTRELRLHDPWQKMWLKPFFLPWFEDFSSTNFLFLRHDFNLFDWQHQKIPHLFLVKWNPTASLFLIKIMSNLSSGPEIIFNNQTK